MTLFSKFVDFLNENNGVLTAVSTFFWGIYVYFTIKTFKEIKKQTDLESKAFVVISASKENSIPKDRDSLKLSESYTKWKRILTSNLPEVNINENILMLKLANKGKSDIHKWYLNIRACIDPSEYLKCECNINGESVNATINSEGAEHYIAAGEDLTIPIAQLAVYPHIGLTWSFTYTDVRGITETAFGGDENFFSTNAMTNPVRS